MTIRTVDYEDIEAGHDFVASLHETGFAVIRNHPLSRRLIDRVYRAWSNFFAGEEKLEFLHDPQNSDGTQQGFYPASASETAVGQELRDLKEYFHVVPGGRIPAALAGDILEYRRTAFDLGKQLACWLQCYSPGSVTRGLPESFAEMLCGEASLLRLLHYPPLSGSESPSAERAAAHEDINLLTLLPVAEQPGLQVRDNVGNWIDVASVRGELVVNSGDMLRELTGGYYPSTTHRVIKPAQGNAVDNVSRISIPFFLTPRSDVVLSERYSSGSYLEERLALINRA